MWQLLSAGPRRRTATGPLCCSVGGRNVLAALDSAGARHVLIPNQTATDVRKVWRSSSILLSRVNMRGDDGVPKTWLDLHCRRPDLEPVFARLVASVIDGCCQPGA